MSDFLWTNEKGATQKLVDIHDKHLVNIVKKLYREAKKVRGDFRRGSAALSPYVVSKQLALTTSITDEDFAHRLFPELDIFLREIWRRGLFNKDAI